MLEMLLALQNPHWSGKRYAEQFRRDLLPVLIRKLDLKEIQVLLGVRRSGKSTLFKLMINHLVQQGVNPHSILYLNLDDPVFVEVWKSAKRLYSVIETVEKLTGTKPAYLFLDEVQNIEAWEQFVKSTYDSEFFKKIFVTGSNSSLLKSDYATLLSGRYLLDNVMPLSLKEIFINEGIITPLDYIQKKASVLRITELFLAYGGFPEVWKNKDLELKREQLIGYYETILLKDCIANHKIRETKKLQDLSLYLLTNNAVSYSYNSLAKIIGSNENTIKEFIHLLEDSFLLREVKHFSYSLKAQSNAYKKTYCVDNGMIYAVSLRFSENRGRLLENHVYNELLKMGYKDIYYYNNQKECDFIIKFEKTIIALQVTYELNQKNYDREINGLSAAMQELSIQQGYIITFNEQEQVIEHNIRVIPVWKLNQTLEIIQQ